MVMLLLFKLHIIFSIEIDYLYLFSILVVKYLYLCSRRAFLIIRF